MDRGLQLGPDGLLGEVRLGRACARALDLEPFPLKSEDGLAAEVERADRLELARVGDDHKWAALRAAVHARPIVEPPHRNMASSS